jgi:hypothetical protein
MPSIRCLIVILLVVCASAITQVANPIFSETVNDLNLRFRTSSVEDTKNLSQAAECFAREIDRVLRVSGTPKERLQLTILRPHEQKSSTDSELCFPFASSSIEISYSLIRAMILRRIRENQQFAGGETASLNWLAAAVCNRVFYDGKGIRTFYSPDFRVPRSQFLSGHFPDLNLLLSQSFPVDDNALFRLYLLHCDLLLSALENQPQAEVFFNKLFELENYGRGSVESFEFLLRPSWPAGETLQSWYEKRVLEESGRGWQLNEADNTLAELQDLLNIPVLQAGGRSAIKRLPLEKIPKLLEDYKLNALAISLMQKRVLGLAKNAPLLLRPPLQQFNQALASLRDGKNSHFRKQFRQARKDFDAALQRQNRIAKMLEQKASQNTPLLDSFETYLEIAEKYRQLHDNMTNIPW